MLQYCNSTIHCYQHLEIWQFPFHFLTHRFHLVYECHLKQTGPTSNRAYKESEFESKKSVMGRSSNLLTVTSREPKPCDPVEFTWKKTHKKSSDKKLVTSFYEKLRAACISLVGTTCNKSVTVNIVTKWWQLVPDLSQQLGTSSANTSWYRLDNNLVTTCFQICNNLGLLLKPGLELTLDETSTCCLFQNFREENAYTDPARTIFEFI
jgi:hypothetical protein